jgi:hypothetical protein
MAGMSASQHLTRLRAFVQPGSSVVHGDAPDTHQRQRQQGQRGRRPWWDLCGRRVSSAPNRFFNFILGITFVRPLFRRDVLGAWVHKPLSAIVPGHVHIKERTMTTTEFKARCLTRLLEMLSVRSAYGANGVDRPRLFAETKQEPDSGGAMAGRGIW